MSDEQATPEVAPQERLPYKSGLVVVDPSQLKPGELGTLTLRYTDSGPELILSGGRAFPRDLPLKDENGRSIAAFSLDTPHTGGQSYAAGVSHAPAACLTLEDAEALWRE